MVKLAPPPLPAPPLALHSADSFSPLTNGSPLIFTATLTAADQSKDIARVFALQQAHEWDVKATNAATSKDRPPQLKASIEARR